MTKLIAAVTMGHLKIVKIIHYNYNSNDIPKGRKLALFWLSSYQ